MKTQRRIFAIAIVGFGIFFMSSCALFNDVVDDTVGAVPSYSSEETPDDPPLGSLCEFYLKDHTPGHETVHGELIYKTWKYLVVRESGIEIWVPREQITFIHVQIKERGKPVEKKHWWKN
ncbi:hypothetical protein HY256_10100 [Candidatus Sumerlaeota bacterium]|nr:hypothetical protein [Candidatus Sumerlaeota bacterium]